MAQEPGTQHFMVLQEAQLPPVRQGSGGQAGRPIGDAAIAAMRQAGYAVVDGTMQRINGHDAYVGLYRGTAKGTGKVVMRAAHIAVGRQLYVVAGFAPEADSQRRRSRHSAVTADVPPALGAGSVERSPEPRSISTSSARATRGNRSRHGRARGSSMPRRLRS